MLFRDARPGASTGRLAGVSLAAPGVRTVTDRSCVRFHAAGGTGVCLLVERSDTAEPYVAILDASLRRTHLFPITGSPSRAQVSADGRMISWTTFVSGHSYTSAGLSTETGFFDRKTGRLWKNLERFRLMKDGTLYKAADLNYWGVTFTRDDDRFYATARTKGTTYLVEGRASTNELRTLRTNVECPSLSPDGTRLAFKKATGDPARPWRLHTLDLRTMRETPLAEPNSVDDQAIWLDAKTVAYGRVRGETADVWAVPADGTGTPRVLLPNAFSPAAIR